MATKTDSKAKSGAEPTLTPAQLNAIDLLATGASVTAAAEAVNVARQTVSEWLNHHAAFMAALNLRRAELWAEQADRYRSLLPQAMDTIAAALKAGGSDGLKAALAIVRMANLNLAPEGEMEAAEIELNKREKAKERWWREMNTH